MIGLAREKSTAEMPPLPLKCVSIPPSTVSKDRGLSVSTAV
jgi:hypothetical protein